jgi:phosphoenolpyruvate phosphomutase
MKKVYVAMSVDFIHHGHLNVISEARKLGDVIIGLLTDKAISTYKRLPFLAYEQRKLIMENIKGVEDVVPQDTVSYKENLLALKPDYVLHGDDWKMGILKDVRQEVIDTLKEWNGKLIEVPYTRGVSSSQFNKRMIDSGITPEIRMKMFRRLLQAKPIVRVLEAHNGMTGLLVENVKLEEGSRIEEFNSLWLSSLTDSTAKGKPDIGFVDFTSRITTLNQILEVTTKPIIFDGDTGGLTEHFVLMVKTLERLGCSAVVIEDKVGLKRNSLYGTDVQQTQDSIENFSHKIASGKKAQANDDFMIVARIESLILKKGIEDALKRSSAFIQAGAEGILIHSKETDPDEIIKFCNAYKQLESQVPLFVVPTTYSTITEKELADVGVNVVIYANHLLRSAYPTMVKTALSILEHQRCHEASDFCLPIKDILELIPDNM